MSSESFPDDDYSRWQELIASHSINLSVESIGSSLPDLSDSHSIYSNDSAVDDVFELELNTSNSVNGEEEQHIYGELASQNLLEIDESEQEKVDTEKEQEDHSNEEDFEVSVNNSSLFMFLYHSTG